MKKIITILVILMGMAGASFGQTDHGYNLYGQLFGSSTGIGVGFDSRLKTGGILGYSAGLAFTDISWSDNYGDGGSLIYREVDSKGVAIPLELNAIMGRRASKFEIGLGMTAYLVSRHEICVNSWIINDNEGDEIGSQHGNGVRNVFRPNIVGTLHIGYRLQRTSGFFMKIGLALLIGDFKCSPIDGVVALPNICLGYTIPHF